MKKIQSSQIYNFSQSVFFFRSPTDTQAQQMFFRVPLVVALQSIPFPPPRTDRHSSCTDDQAPRVRYGDGSSNCVYSAHSPHKHTQKLTVDAAAGAVDDPWPTAEATAAVSMHTCTTISCSCCDRIVDGGPAPYTRVGRGPSVRPCYRSNERERSIWICECGRPSDVPEPLVSDAVTCYASRVHTLNRVIASYCASLPLRRRPLRRRRRKESAPASGPDASKSGRARARYRQPRVISFWYCGRGMYLIYTYISYYYYTYPYDSLPTLTFLRTLRP